MPWKVEYTPKFLEDLQGIPQKDGKRISSFLKRLENHPDVWSISVKLEGSKRSARRFKVGDYRVLALVYADNNTMLLFAVGQRKDIYKKFR